MTVVQNCLFIVCTQYSIVVTQSKQTFVEGLLDSTMKLFKLSAVFTELLVVVSTDGEAANTGLENVCWKLLERKLGHGLLTVWCYYHRSDLAMESALATAPELKLKMSNLTAVSKYYRNAPSKLKKMILTFPDYHAFLPYFEVDLLSMYTN